MDYIHEHEYLSEGDMVIVNCSHQCNVMLTDDANYQRYRRGEQFEGYGGFFEILPAEVPVPYTGYWNITIDLAGGRANINYSIDFLKRN